MSKKTKINNPHWHPNIRIRSTLPDIKVIRTDFAINILSLILILASIFTIIQREFAIRSIQAEVMQLDAKVSSTKPENDRLLKISEEFKENSESIQDLQRFYNLPIKHVDVLTTLSVIKPEDLKIDSLSFSEFLTGEGKKLKIGYSINLSGNARSLTSVSRFKDILNDNEQLVIENFEKGVSEDVQNPDQQTRLVPFSIKISFDPQ